MNREELERAIEELGPWFYPFDLGDGLRTTPAIPPHVTKIFGTRLEMVTGVVERHFGSRLPEIRCLDIGSHEGFYSFEMAKLGVGHVTGLEYRDINLRKARFVAERVGLSHVDLRQGNVEDLSPRQWSPYELTLFLGVLYHLENPVLCLRNVSRVTKEVCVIETQVVPEVEGEAEWGAREWTRPYQGILAVIDESDDFNANNTETGHSPVVTCPSPKALEFLLKQTGFQRVEFIDPPPDAYEQHARGQRVVCAAFK